MMLNMNTSLSWQRTPIDIEVWKANCFASSHVRPGDSVHFNESRGVVSAWIDGTSVCLGYFFVKADGNIMASTGWNHE
jgi:hypothetical protein